MIESTLSLEAMPGGMIAIRSVDNCSSNIASQTAIVNVVVRNGENKTPDIQINDEIVSSGEDCVTYHTFKDGDGLYKVYHFVIPNNPNAGSSLYCQDKKVYWGNEEITDPEEIKYYIDDYIEEDLFGYTETLTVNTYDLHECYRKIANEIFKRKDTCNTKAYSDLIYKRDMVWMAINVINYMIDEGQTELIESLLHKIHSCHGICKTINKTNKGCGCS